MSLFNNPFQHSSVRPGGLFNAGVGSQSPYAARPDAFMRHQQPATNYHNPFEQPSGMGLLPTPSVDQPPQTAPAPTQPQMPSPPPELQQPQTQAQSSPLAEMLMGGPAGLTGPQVPFSMGAYLNPDFGPTPETGRTPLGPTGPIVPATAGAYTNPNFGNPFSRESR